MSYTGSQYVAIVGAQRCGTTWLYEMLDQHPNVSMAKPVRPEPKFFLNNDLIDNGIEYYQRTYFGGKPATVIGEKSTSYLESPLAAKRIKSFYPNAKIIVMLRNPVDRAISNYFFSVKNGLETRSLEEVFIDQMPPPRMNRDVSVSPFDYLARGLYQRFIDSYRDVFSNDNVMVVISEQITRDISRLADLYAFLGVDPSFRPSAYHSKRNQYAEGEPVPDVIRTKLRKYYMDRLGMLPLGIGESCWGFSD